MTIRALIFILNLSLFAAFSVSAQFDTSSVVFFDNRFQAERDIEYAAFYGTPKKIDANKYEVVFYTMAGQKFAMGEYNGSNFKNRNGIFVRYDTEGKITTSVTYEKGLMHGIYRRWHNNGVLADSGQMERNHNIGIWKSWHPNGQLGEVKYYKLVKAPKNALPYGVLDGEYRSWDESGKLKDSGYYKDGLKIEVWIEWVQNGELRSLGVYQNGMRYGEWKFYDKSGKFLYVRSYRNKLETWLIY